MVHYSTASQLFSQPRAPLQGQKYTRDPLMYVCGLIFFSFCLLLSYVKEQHEGNALRYQTCIENICTMSIQNTHNIQHFGLPPIHHNIFSYSVVICCFVFHQLHLLPYCSSWLLYIVYIFYIFIERCGFLN